LYNITLIIPMMTFCFNKCKYTNSMMCRILHIIKYSKPLSKKIYYFLTELVLFSLCLSNSHPKIKKIKKSLSNKLANYTHRCICTRLLSGRLQFQSSAIPVAQYGGVVVSTDHSLKPDTWNESVKIKHITTL